MTKIPPDFAKDLKKNSKSYEQWNKLTPIAQRDFSRWIESAKESDTRIRRIKRACDMLEKGKRRPCCYSIIPLDFYKALKKYPKAKANWSKLTAPQKRDLVDHIDEIKDSKKRADKIEKICSDLTNKKL